MSLVVDSVSVAVHHHTILRDVDLTLPDGEVMAILGPSGSGKTTLLRVIAGLQTPSSGSVTLDGVDLTDVPVHRRGIGLMFQDHALFPHRNVQGNVAFGLRMARRSRSDIASRVDEVLDLVGLAGMAKRRIDGLSGGERQRVALARALAPQPDLLLLDEPLGSLDRALRERLVGDLSEVLRASGVSAIYVTHDQAEAFAIGDRLAVMRGGTIAQVALPEQVWSTPIDAGVARIVGPVSLLPIEIGSDGSVPDRWRGVVAPPKGASPGPAYVVVRADTFRIDGHHDGPFGGEVIDLTFRGDHHLVTVGFDLPECGSTRLEIEVAHWGSDRPRVGDRVVLRVEHPPSVVPPAP